MAMTIKDNLLKKPFVRIRSAFKAVPRVVNSQDSIEPCDDRGTFEVVSQSDFLREYYPSGHKIKDELYYPDKIHKVEETGDYWKEQMFRAVFPFQQIITIQQLVHLCGNDIHMELTGIHNDPEEHALLLQLKKGWLDKNIEIAFYKLAKSTKITGDGALVFYMNGGEFGWKSLSYIDGDTLFPYFNPISGKLERFARRYYDFDEDGKETICYVEIWDEHNFYRYKQDLNGLRGVVNKTKEWFGLEGYSLIEAKPHQFPGIPVVYTRDDGGACWSAVQDPIDKYELAVSQLCQNNMAYAFPIMVLKGEDVDIQGDPYNGVKAITMGADDDAKYLSHDDSSKAFELQLETLLKMIFLGSFTVQPPEVKSGDLPGVAIKLIYSPSLEKAMIDAKEFDGAVDDITQLFKYGYGLEMKAATAFSNLDVFSWIEPYVHQNTSELVNNLCMLVNANLLSRDTGSTLSGYGENNEFDKIMTEWKQQQAADLLYDLNGAINTSTNTDSGNGGDE